MNSHPSIFIHGILSRSGSNYLAHLLDIHVDCTLSSIPEDWFLSDSRHLVRYSDSVSERWCRDPAWNIEPAAKEDLLRNLGDALVSFLRSRSEVAKGSRLLTKTPDVNALPNFFRLFPDAYLLILVRDGRSVVESSMRSFNTPVHQVTDWWRRAAGQIIHFDRAHRESNRRYCLVRYEDLVRDPCKEMNEILRFLDLEPKAYDFSRIESLPVFGSSTGRTASGEWEWKIAPDSGELGSIERWSGWSRRQHERFNWAAGERLEALGYQMKTFSDHRLLWRAAKAGWLVEEKLRDAYQRIAAVPRRWR